MGTLTANLPELAEHCPHKLPTSCRLTATPTCCACQDNRPHSAAYPTYVDGVGLVARGTRWQRYCWFCKEFWSARVAAVRPTMDPRETRIPGEPDQTQFLEKWFEYYRGHRVEKNEHDGTVRVVEVICEKPWRDVPPGELPVINEQDRIVTSRRVIPQSSEVMHHVSLDSALDELLATANEETTEHPHAATPASTNRVTLSAPDVQELRERLRQANARLNVAEARRRELAEEVRAADEEVRAAREQKASLNRENQMARFTRVFGSREEMQASDYVSPLTEMFSRAYDRYRVAEEVRTEARIWQLSSEQQRLLWTRDTTVQDLAQFQPGGPGSSRLQEEAAIEAPSRTLDDEESNRPPPQTEEQMTLVLSCKICLQQKADTAVLPCGHFIMCSYCAEIAIPTKDNEALQPQRRNAQCPFCRKSVRRLVRIYTA